MSRYIEYYEYRDIYADDIKTEYFYMPVNSLARHKKNLDDGSKRIWRYDTWFDKVYYERYHNKYGPNAHSYPVDMNEFNQIVLESDSCPYSEQYLIAERLANKRIKK